MDDCVATLPVRRLAQQVSEGDNKAERPMWAEKGGLDFEGRARWDAWTQRKGLAPDKAKAEFVKVVPVQTPFLPFPSLMLIDTHTTCLITHVRPQWSVPCTSSC